MPSQTKQRATAMVASTANLHAVASEFVATIFTANTEEDITARFREILDVLLPNISIYTHRILEQSGDRIVYEVIFALEAPFSLTALRRDPGWSTFERTKSCQIAIQAEHAFRRHKRLAVFDMDSTLIQQEVIDEIARKIGVEADVSAITERAMNGELDFTESLRARCALLKGVSSSVFRELRDVISLTPGATELIKALKRLGYKTAVLSGGFLPLTSWQAGQLGLDYAYANQLVVSEDGSHLTGELTGEIVHAERKAELVCKIATEMDVALDQVFTVGDGANDLPMMWTAGLGVAYNAKQRVQEAAPVRINTGSLQDVLYLLGLSSSEQAALLS